MALPKLTFNVRNTLLESGEAQVEITTIDAQGIDRYIFVYDTENTQFQHVATARDLRNTVSDYSTAKAEDHFYYRAAYASKTFSTIDEANDWRAMTLSAASALTHQWQSYTDGFPDEEIITIEAP